MCIGSHASTSVLTFSSLMKTSLGRPPLFMVEKFIFNTHGGRNQDEELRGGVLEMV